MKNSIKKSWIWAIVFIIGIIVGVVSHKLLLPHLLPVMLQIFDYKDNTSIAKVVATNPFLFTIAIFLKNLSVAMMCFLTAKLSKGLVPGFIMFVNGIIIGFAITILNVSGIPMKSIVMAILPHGIIELPALFLFCAIGMYGLNKESWRIAGVPILMLFIAAGVESYITPLIA